MIGGSFLPRGGHNPLEPAAWGVPIVSGESMFNFEDIARQLREAGALQQVADAAALATCLGQLLGDAPERERRGRAGRGVVEANRGAVDALVAAVEGLLAAAHR